MSHSEYFHAEMRVNEALRVFRGHVNSPATIFSRDHWLTPKLGELKRLLSDPITADQAQALDDVLHGRHYMKDMIEWLNSESIDWTNFFSYREQRRRDDLWAQFLKGNEEDLEGDEQVDPRGIDCPKCSSRRVIPVYLWLSFGRH